MCALLYNLPRSFSDDKLRSGKTGLSAIIKCGQMLELLELTKVVNESQGQAIPIKNHQRCQKDVYSTIRSHERSLKSNKPSAKKARLSRSIQKDARFEWNSCSLFCTQLCSADERRPDRSNLGRCSYKEFQETWLQHFEGKTGDKAALLQQKTSNFVKLLRLCYRWSTDRTETVSTLTHYVQNRTPTLVRVRPVNSKEEKNFETLCKWLEGEVALYTVCQNCARR